MPAPSSLVCLACGAPTSEQAGQACERCWGPLAISVDWEALDRSVIAAGIKAGPQSMWRYADLLPLAGDGGAGCTPLVRAERLGAALGLDDLWLKDETANPTASFKDRVVEMALARARALGLGVVACASTGNLARALAAGAARAGMDALVLVPESLEPEALAAMAEHGALVLAVRGPYDAANRLSVLASMELEGVGWVNIELRPWYVEGGATVAYEIAEQLGWCAPDHVVAPMASGALVTKLHDGLEAVRRIGLVPSHPTRISGVQPAGCSPIARAFAVGANTVAPVRETSTAAPSLAMGDPPDGDRVIAIARSTGGTVIEVPEEEIAGAVDLLAATEGIAVEPAGGVVVAALAQMAARGEAFAGERIVAVLTGGPAPAGMAGDAEGFGTIDPTVEALRSALTDRSRNR